MLVELEGEVARVEELVADVVGLELLELLELEVLELEVLELEALGLEVLEDVSLALELVAEPPLVEADPLLGAPKTPPWALAGAELVPAPAAAALNAARVSCPPELKRSIVVNVDELVNFTTLVYSRRVDHCNHASLTVSNLSTV